MEVPSQYIFSGNGSTAIFPVATEILGNSYVKIFVSGVEIVDTTTYDIINNSIVFREAPETGTDNIIIWVASSIEALESYIGNLVFSLGSLNNVVITDNTEGEILKWNGTDWINNTLAEAGISDTSHNHSGVYEPVFTKNTAFNKNFGTTSGTVAEGNHNHSGVYEPASSYLMKTNVAQTMSAELTVKETKETYYTMTGTVIDPANGTIQFKEITASVTLTEVLESGQSITLMIKDADLYTLTLPTLTWCTTAGNVAPEWTGLDTIVLWKVSTVLFGAYLGSYE